MEAKWYMYLGLRLVWIWGKDYWVPLQSLDNIYQLNCLIHWIYITGILWNIHLCVTQYIPPCGRSGSVWMGSWWGVTACFGKAFRQCINSHTLHRSMESSALGFCHLFCDPRSCMHKLQLYYINLFEHLCDILITFCFLSISTPKAEWFMFHYIQ